MPFVFPRWGPPGPLPDDAITIAASTWRWDGVSGVGRISSGFALQPGMLTASNVNTFRVYVAGVEQAIALNPLDGWFPDGSYRSPGVQFIYNLTNDTPVSAEIRINQGVRATTDIAWIDPTRPMVLKRAVVAPTDPVHLCGTMVTLTPLTPKANDTGTDAAWGAFAETTWLTYPGIADGSNPGTAIYDHVAGLWNLYCRTGVRAWYQRAYDWAIGFIGDAGIDAQAYAVVLVPPLVPSATGAESVPGACSDENKWNPEHLRNTQSGGDCGNPTEAFGHARWFSLTASYWMTAYRQYKRLIAINANYGLTGTESGYPTYRDRCVSTKWGQRFNLRYVLNTPLFGYLTGCTTNMVYPGGFGGIAVWDYATYLDWMLNALEYYVWNLPGDYRNGLVGQRHVTIDTVQNPGATLYAGVTNFQLSIMAEWLMAVFDHAKPDSRIPPMIKIMCDYIITQIKPAQPWDFRADLGAAWMGSYINLPPVAAQSFAFTANTVNTNTTITRTGGDLPTEYFSQGVYLTGPGIPLNTGGYSPSGTDSINLYDTNDWVTLRPANATGTGVTLHAIGSPYDMLMYAPMFAWYYAYSGTALYNTWATRMSDNMVAMAAMTYQKNWGEIWGGARQAFLYYRHGGAIRGTPGAHPTVITNPPLQPSLG